LVEGILNITHRDSALPRNKRCRNPKFTVRIFTGAIAPRVIIDKPQRQDGNC
jgi:hypothetical protein